MEIQTLRQFIYQLEGMLRFMKQLAASEEAMHAAPDDADDKLRELTELRMLAKSDVWPLAVDPDLILKTKEDKLHRAASILNGLITVDLTDKKILDIGTGEGYIPYVAASLFGPRHTIGYDITNQNWNDLKPINGLEYTTSWEAVKEHGPYNIIILNDVLDHAADLDFAKIRELKSEDGRIFVRCHPWASRHGAHVHETLNRAYLHLVFSEQELATMGIKAKPVQKLLDPLTAYKKVFKDAGLSIVRENVHRHDMEFFFVQTPAIQRRIKEKWKIDENSTQPFPRPILEIESVDFTLM